MISGDVNVDGRPLKIGQNVRGTVVFQPISHQGPVLNGMIGRSGHFQLTVGSSRSIQPGVYLATVSAVEIEPVQDGNTLPSGKRITPERYSSSDTSGLRIEVKPGENHVILDLKSDPPDGDIVESSPAKSKAATRPTESLPTSSNDASSKAVHQEQTDELDQDEK